MKVELDLLIRTAGLVGLVRTRGFFVSGPISIDVALDGREGFRVRRWWQRADLHRQRMEVLAVPHQVAWRFDRPTNAFTPAGLKDRLQDSALQRYWCC